MIEKDINLFEAGQAKAAHRQGGGGVVLLLTLFFALIVGGCYAWILYMQSGLEEKTLQIQQQLADPQLVEAQQRLYAELEKFNRMAEYQAALTAAGSAFDHTRVISPALLGQLTGCLTADTALDSFSITLQGATLVCRSPSFLAVAAITQALEQLDAVARASYDSVIQGPDGLYRFTLACSFEEVTLP